MDAELVKGTLALLILSLLSRKPMYGYEMATTVHAETDGAFEWKEGSLYPSLHKLERAGLIESEWQGEAGTRRRKYYRLKKSGTRALAEHRDQWMLVHNTFQQLWEKGLCTT